MNKSLKFSFFYVRPGAVGLSMNLSEKEIDDGMFKIGLKLKDSIEGITIFEQYNIFKMYATNKNKMSFLRKLLWLKISEFIGYPDFSYKYYINFVIPKDILYNNDIYKNICVTNDLNKIEKYAQMLDTKTIKWKIWWKITNIFQIKTPGYISNIDNEIHRLGFDININNELFNDYYSSNRTLENLALSLIDTINSTDDYINADIVVKCWIEFYFAQKGFDIMVQDLEHNIITNIDNENIDNELRHDYKKIINMLPSLPNKWKYAIDFLEYIYTKIWAKSIVCWMEWCALKIPRFKHHKKLVNLLDNKLLYTLSSINSLYDLVLKSPPKHLLDKQIYCWKLLLDNISYALRKRIVQKDKSTDPKFLKSWYQKDPMFCMLSLLKIYLHNIDNNDNNYSSYIKDIYVERINTLSFINFYENE